ncbi:MAG: tripartite tricarboxylate transporter TctB family protein [Phyllobacteriaceae bacterium]|nr:tripartite tricarboxylate transporter TctB family protein [Phyllobacteriaceae bacterium]
MSNVATPTNRVESFALNGVFAAISFALLAALPFATRSGPDKSGWWTQPWTMPLIALTVLCIGNAVTLFLAGRDLMANRPTGDEVAAARAAIFGWFRPIEFFAYFLGYIWLLGRAGYFLSTALFIQFLLFRVGLRQRKWIVAGLAAALALTAIFRWGLGIWVPTADLYGLFPDAMRKFASKWF